MMKYFLHDSNAFNDEKITELFMQFGYEGLGLFYTILEKIAGQEKPVKTSVLKSQLGVGKRLEKCWSFMESLGIISSNNGETFNERILSYSEMYQIKKQKTRERISEWRNNQLVEKNVTRYESVSNAHKVKLSKVNIDKGINYCFEIFWDLYDKKIGDKVKLQKKWDEFNDETRQLIIDHIPKYKKSKPDKNFRKDPATYFNNKSWNDEIIFQENGTVKKINGESNAGIKQRDLGANQLLERGKKLFDTYTGGEKDY